MNLLKRDSEKSHSHAPGSSSASTAGNHAHHNHVTPLWIYYAVFAVLLVLTVLTVVVSRLGLPPTPSLGVAMFVAFIKASLVALYFMHLKYEDKYYGFIFAASLIFVALFFAVVLTDMDSRAAINEEEGNFGIERETGKVFQPNPVAPAGTAPKAEEKKEH